MKTIKIIPILSLIALTVQANSLKDTVTQTVLTNSEIISNQLKIKSSQKEIRLEKSGYYPTLDLDAFVEKSYTKNHRRNQSEEAWERVNGYNAKLTLEQLLYDGGKTISKIDEKQYNYNANSFKYTQKNESLVFDISKSYLDLVKYEELSQLMSYLNQAHSKALDIAHDKEEISGEVLETLKTIDLITTQDDKKLSQENKLSAAKANYKRLTSIEPVGIICRPKFSEVKIPNTLKETVLFAFENNYEIKEQRELIKKQQEKLSQTNSSFRPNLKLVLSGAYDKDLELREDGTQKELLGQIVLNWNFYSGGKDMANSEKEQIILNEEQKNLEIIVKRIIEKTTNLYTTRIKTIQRIKNFEKSIVTKKEILKLTNNQLEDGTKTFLDVLQAKIKIIDAQNNKITQEFILLETNYELLSQFSILTKTISEDKNQVCMLSKLENSIKENEANDEDLDGLLDDEQTPIVANAKPIVEKENIKEETLGEKLSHAFRSTDNFDKEKLTVTLPITFRSFTKKTVNPYDQFKYTMDRISPKLLKTINENKDKIDYINLESFTSAEYTKYKHLGKKKEFEANMGLSQRRINKVKNYLLKKSAKLGYDTKWLNSHLSAQGKGSSILILNNGVEDKIASRRVVINIIEK